MNLVDRDLTEHQITQTMTLFTHTQQIDWSRQGESDCLMVEKRAQTMLQLVKFGIDWKCGELEQILNIPVTQIVEEITEVSKSSSE